MCECRSRFASAGTTNRGGIDADTSLMTAELNGSTPIAFTSLTASQFKAMADRAQIGAVMQPSVTPRSKALVAVLIALGLAACGDDHRIDHLAGGERGRVVEVRSGDVLVLDTGLVVRLAQIDAPHMDQPGADQARGDLQRLAGGQDVQLLYGGARRDGYGRALAQVRRAKDHVWLQAALLRDGWARVRTYADNHVEIRALLDDEAKARSKRLGLWSLADDQVRLPSEIDRGVRGFQIVEGRVAEVSQGRNATFLEFSGDRRGFAAVIPDAAQEQFRKTDLRPASLANRLVRVRGVIDWDGLMRLDHPEQIERLKEK